MWKVFVVVLLTWQEIAGHGFMYFPPGWNQYTACKEDKGPQYCKYKVDFNIPDENCKTVDDGASCSKYAFRGNYDKDWFTNDTRIDGPPTIPEDLYDEYSAKWSSTTPWNNPGSAPVFGEGCGVNGGNPDGCGTGPYGSCCGSHCLGYAFGKSALEHAAEGVFANAFTTTWARGSSQPVMWSSGMNHRGGYAYRLCKVPEGGISMVSEDCFKNGHLEFDGDVQWIVESPDKEMTKGWTEIDAVRTTIGTTPEGSQWTRISVPVPPGGKEQWSIKDYVKVPEGLEPGMYVLSFRWDCLKSPQIWSMCANIEIV